MNLRNDIDRAVSRLRERLDAIDEEIGVLTSDMPGDPGVIRWPRQLEDAVDVLHDERIEVMRQITVLLGLRRQVVCA